MPGTIGEVLTARVVGTVELTYPGAGKAKRELQIDLGDQLIEYEPGDSFYFIVANPREEVNYILERYRFLKMIAMRRDFKESEHLLIIRALKCIAVH